MNLLLLIELKMSTTNVWQIIGAAVIGIIGAASVLIVEHLRQKKQRHAQTQEIDRMNRQLSLMRTELDNLRQLQNKNEKKVKNRRNRNSFTSTTTTSTEDYRSALDVDSSDEMFYDLSDDELLLGTEEPIDSLLEEFDGNLDSGKIDIIKETLVIMNNVLEKYPNNTKLSWRIARAYHQIASLETEPAVKQDIIQKGIKICSDALKIDSETYEIHKWYAILVGSRTEFQTTKDKIADGHLYKKHIDIAIKLNPTDSSLHHLLGRFCYEVAGLSWLERTAAMALFEEPPSATYQEALNHFLKAENLCEREWKENHLFIGKCYAANGDYKDAIKWLEKAINIDCEDEIEKQCDSEIKVLLTKCYNYR